MIYMKSSQKLYDSEKGILIKESADKEISYTSDELVLYLYSLILYSDFNNVEDNSRMLQDNF